MARPTSSWARGRTGLVCLIALADVVLAGCGSSGGRTTGSAGHGTSTGPEPSVNISSTPRTEQPTTERPRTGVRSVSISFPILVPGQGGAGEHEAKYQCVVAGWYGYAGQVYVPIPDDVVLAISGIAFDPEGIFVAGGDLNACPVGQRLHACDTSTTFTSRHDACQLVVTQIAEADPRVRVYVHMSATATCGRAESCEAIQKVAASGGEKVYFQPVLGAVSATATGTTSAETGRPAATPSDTGAPSQPIESTPGG